MRKQTKIAAIASAAALLAIGASMTSFAAVGWVENPVGSGEWQWLDSYGDPVYDEWRTSGTEWFYLGEDGYMLKDQIFTDSQDHTFCVDSYGRRMYGWVSLPNDDDLDVNGDGVSESVLWMYFGSNGRAIKAAPGEVTLKDATWSGGTNKFLFNSDGYMLSGWYNDRNGTIYYLGSEDEGWARTGWQYLPNDETIDHVCPDEKAAEHWYYFNPSNCKAYTDADGEKYIDKKWYSFDEVGHLNETWVGIDKYPGTPATALNGLHIYNDTYGSDGYGWVYTSGKNAKGDDGNYWYYLTTYRDAENHATRSIAFNEGVNNMTAKAINGKIYLFDTKGCMLTGLQVLDKSTTVKTDLYDTVYKSIAASVKELPAGTYYFNEPENPKASTAGQMVTGRVTYFDPVEMQNYYYSFAKKDTTYEGVEGAHSYTVVQGEAYKSAIVDGTLYGKDGKRVQAEDGNSYTLVSVKDVASIEYGILRWIKGGKVYAIGTDSVIAVSSSGRVKTSGDIRIDGVNYRVDKDTLNVTETGN